jgi:exonuclease VII large subunit
MENKNQHLDRKIAHLDELFSEADNVVHLSAEEIKAELKREGIDTTKSLAALQEKFTAIQRREKIKVAGEKRQALLQTLATGVSKVAAATRTEIDALLSDLKASNPGAAQVYACRLEKATEEDLESLKRDLELVRKMSHGSQRHD